MKSRRTPTLAPARRPVSSPRQRWRCLLAAVLAAVAALVAGPGAAVEAAWNTAAAGPSRARAGTMPAGNAPLVANTAPNAPAVAVSWAASAPMPNGAGYVIRSFNATTGVERPITVACSGVVLSVACTEAAVPSGSWRYTVTPTLGAWRGAASAPSAPVLVDTTAPTVAFTHPVAASSYTRATWNAACSSSICATASDAHSGLQSVAISIRRGTGNYWNGTAFASAAEVLHATTGTATRQLAFPDTNFLAGGQYTVRAVATDARGNTATTSRTFTMDIPLPQATLVTLANGGGGAVGRVNAGDTIQLTFSDRLAPSSICSAWTGAGPYTLSNVTVSVRDLLAVAEPWVFASPSCALNIGEVVTASDYVSVTGLLLAFPSSTVTFDAAVNRITIQYGAPVGVGLDLLADPPHNVTYNPSTAIRDLAGNPINPAPVSNTGQRF